MQAEQSGREPVLLGMLKPEPHIAGPLLESLLWSIFNCFFSLLLSNSLESFVLCILKFQNRDLKE